MAKVLVGIPAFRIPCIVRSSISSLVNTPADVVVVDNAADEDVKQVLRSFQPRIHVISNSENGYCNGAWNQIMEYGLSKDYDLIALGTGTTLRYGWYEGVCKRLNSLNEVWLPSIGPNQADKVAVNVAGFFTFMPRAAIELVYPIPRTLKHWFGDTYMFNKLQANGWTVKIMGDVHAEHDWGKVMISNPDTYPVIEQDKEAWRKLHEA